MNSLLLICRAGFNEYRRPVRRRVFRIGCLRRLSFLSKPKIFRLLASAAVLFSFCCPADAQQHTKIPRVAFVRLTRQADEPRHGRLQEFRRGLGDLGYSEGQNIILKLRWAEDRRDRLSEIMSELVRLKVDVIVTHGPLGVRAAKRATKTIPIVVARMTMPT